MRRVPTLSDGGHFKGRWLFGALVLTAMVTLQAGCGKPETPQSGPVKKLGDGDSPILISDGSSPLPENAGKAATTPAAQAIWMQSSVAFSSMANNNAQKPTELYPAYANFNGADISVDGMTAVSICSASQNCEIKIWYSGDGADPKISFHFNPNATSKKFDLKSDQDTFNTWTGFSTNGMTITDSVAGRITKVEVNNNGMPYTPTMTCTITLHVN